MDLRTPVDNPPGDALPALVSAIPGPRATAWCEILAEVECPALTARRRRRAERSGAPQDPIVWAASRGSNVTDVDGNRYVDLTAGFGAALVGHGHPHIVAAVQRQSERLLHALGDVYPSDAKIALEARLAALAPWPSARVLLGLSGADAIEAALKTCALATGRPGVLVFRGGYHGLSYGALAIGAYSEAFRRPFAAQSNPHRRVAEYPRAGDADACARALDDVSRALEDGLVGAVVIEPVRARGGVAVADSSTCEAIVALAHDAGALVVADEIYCGMYRTGCGPSFSAARWRDGARPDLIVWGKALGGSLPVSACVVREEVARAWGDPDQETIHTSTFLGNPLGCAAALAALDVMQSDGFDAFVRARAESVHARVIGPLLRAPKNSLLAVDGVSGEGLLVGLKLRAPSLPVPALSVMRALLARGYLVLPAGAAADEIALTPAITLTDAQLDAFAQALGGSLEAAARAAP